jgi:hypothetical protein
MENYILDLIKECLDEGYLDLATTTLTNSSLSDGNRMLALAEFGRRK